MSRWLSVGLSDDLKPKVGTELAADGGSTNHYMSNSKLYVGNLSFKTSDDALRTHFSQYGSVTDVYVAMDKMTGRPRGFAFITMGTPEEAKVAAEKTNGVEFDGRPLTVNEAREELRLGI